MALGRKTGGGSRKGILSKTTRDVRAAIAQFAEGNVEKLRGWLDRVAARDPAKAAELFVRGLEYHIPKLARTDLTGDAANTTPVVRVTFVSPDPSRESDTP